MKVNISCKYFHFKLLVFYDSETSVQEVMDLVVCHLQQSVYSEETSAGWTENGVISVNGNM